MEGLVFNKPENIVGDFNDLKSLENADLLIALSHLGYPGNSYLLGDGMLASQYAWFDMIVGGHTHQIVNTKFNNILIFQSGSYLHNLGKIKLTIKTKKSSHMNLMNL